MPRRKTTPGVQVPREVWSSVATAVRKELARLQRDIPKEELDAEGGAQNYLANRLGCSQERVSVAQRGIEPVGLKFLWALHKWTGGSFDKILGVDADVARRETREQSSRSSETRRSRS
jgi:hypothetical protein